MSLAANTIIEGNCISVMAGMPEGSVDLTVTSPPYDNLRSYEGYEFDAEGIMQGLLRVTADGGVCIWNVADATIDGQRTGTSFRQAIMAQDMGWKLYDVLIWVKPNTPFSNVNRYTNCFEYLFALVKGDKPKTFNGLREDKTTMKGGKFKVASNNTDKGYNYVLKDIGDPRPDKIRTNVWRIPVGCGHTTPQGATAHPAPFPDALAKDCILSWSAKGDVVLDPMCGSGTTCFVANGLGRRYVGIDISGEYCGIARGRIANDAPLL